MILVRKILPYLIAALALALALFFACATGAPAAAVTAAAAAAPPTPPAAPPPAGSDAAGKAEKPPAPAPAAQPAPAPAAKDKEAPRPAENKALKSEQAAAADLPAERKAADAPAPAPAVRPKLMARPGAKPQASGLSAGVADDNRQFNFFVQFLDKYKQVPHIELPVKERVVLKVKDSAGRSVPNARVQFFLGNAVVSDGLTLADGSYYFFPREFPNWASDYPFWIKYNRQEIKGVVTRDGPRELVYSFKEPRLIESPVPLDVVFILDTTGSMGEEIERLKATIELIHMNLSSLSTKPRVRFGMILYKDRGDVYTAKQIPLTGDLEEFQAALNEVQADGGGDEPEDLQEALKEAVNGLKWSAGGVRLGFIITDAPAHLDYADQKYNYENAVRDARKKGLKFFSVGTGGLPLEGEYVLRQIAQFTGGKYIFLTYGEKGEAEGGAPGSVSHHTGANFTTDKLEAVIIRLAREELQHLTDEPIKSEEDYFQAVKLPDEDRAATLKKLFSRALRQLVDISPIRIAADTPVALVPLLESNGKRTKLTEFFSEQVQLAASELKQFKLAAGRQRDIQQLLKQLELQVSGLVPPEKVTRFGRFLGAQAVLSGTVFTRADGYEVFIRLIRVETAEILAVANARLAKDLGL